MSTFTFVRFQDFFNVAPNAPVLTTRTDFDGNNAVQFEWDFDDDNSDDVQTAFQLQIDNVSTGVTAFDSGKVSSANEFFELSAETLINGEEWRWRVRTWDSFDFDGPFSSYSTFNTSEGPTVAITAPTNEQEFDVSQVLVEWDYTHPDSTPQGEYRIRFIDLGSSAVVIDTDWVASTSSSVLVSEVPTGSLRVEVRARTNGIEGNTDTVDIEVDYASPDEPSIVVEAFEEYLRITVTNPEPTGDKPFVVGNHLLRKGPFDDDYIRISTTISNNGQYRDYTVGSGLVYDYRARAVAEQAGTLSAPVSGSLTLEGVWLHQTENPQDTSLHMRFWAGSRRESRGLDVSLLTFAGREFPVPDIGEHRTHEILVPVLIPWDVDHDSSLRTLRQVFQGRRVLTYRDNRGRVIFGTITGIPFVDVREGTQVNLTIQRVEHEEAI